MEAMTSFAEEAFDDLLADGMTANDIAVELGVTIAVATQLEARELQLGALIRSPEYWSAPDDDAASERRRAAFRAAQMCDNAHQEPRASDH